MGSQDVTAAVTPGRSAFSEWSPASSTISRPEPGGKISARFSILPLPAEEVAGAPDAPLCRDDCPGLCPRCGADLQLAPCDCDLTERDERWSALDQLRLDE